VNNNKKFAFSHQIFMHKFILTLVLLVGTITGCDKVIEEDTTKNPPVPAAVVSSLNTQFSGLSNLVVADLKTDSLYSADFWANNRQYKTIVHSSGTVKNVGRDNDGATLPVNVTRYVEPAVVEGALEQLTPLSLAQNGHLVQALTDTGRYLLAFDHLGGHISAEPVPASGKWWRYQVAEPGDLPTPVANAVFSQFPNHTFHHATLMVDDNQNARWYVGLINTSLLVCFELDGTGTTLAAIQTKDLLRANESGVTLLDIDVTQLPTVVKNHLDTHFTGWGFARGLMRLKNGSLNGFTIVITVNQTTYFTNFNELGQFKSANKG
jgi:hypothetical protein